MRRPGLGVELVGDSGTTDRWNVAPFKTTMRGLPVLSERLNTLVPPDTSPTTPPDQRQLFDLLVELNAALHRCPNNELKETQRAIEDVLLRVTCGGWAGPAVRNAAANTLANVFIVGNKVALFSCVNELSSKAFAESGKKTKLDKMNAEYPLQAGLNLSGACRVGALDCLARLARSGHAENMRGAVGGIVNSSEKILFSRSNEKATREDGSEKGTRAVRSAVLRVVCAVVGSGGPGGIDNKSKNDSNPARPLRASTRAAAGRTLVTVLAKGFETNANSKNSNASPPDGGTRACACRGIGALASSLGGYELWTDVSVHAKSNRNQSPPTIGSDAANELLKLLDDQCRETSAAAACAFGKLAACRLRVKTHSEKAAEAAVSDSRDESNNGATPGHTKTKSKTSGLSFPFGGMRRKNDDGKKNTIKTSAESAVAAEAAAAMAAAVPLDLDRPGGAELWTETVQLCFLTPLLEHERSFQNTSSGHKKHDAQLFEKRRRFRSGVTHAICVFVREASISTGSDLFLPKGVLIDMAETVLLVFTGGINTGSADSHTEKHTSPQNMFVDDPKHAAACANHVVQHGVLPHLDESGRKGLVLRMLGLLQETWDDSIYGSMSNQSTLNHNQYNNDSRSKKVPCASATLCSVTDALIASGRVDVSVFELASDMLASSHAALREPEHAAVATRALAACAPEHAAALLRGATSSMSMETNDESEVDKNDVVKKARLGARVASELISNADTFELGLPKRDVVGAARAAFELATKGLTLEDGSNENEIAVTKSFGWSATASALVFLSTHVTDRNEVGDLPLDVDTVFNALTAVLEPFGLIEAAEREQERNLEKQTASTGGSMLGSLSLFGSPRKPKKVAESSSKSKSYGSLDESATPASITSQPGSPKRSPKHSRNSSLAGSQHTWAPSHEMTLRAAAADALPAFAMFASSRLFTHSGDTKSAKDMMLPLLRDALSCACHPTPIAGEKSSWPMDSDSAYAAASLRVRALEAFVSVPHWVFSSTTNAHRNDVNHVFDAAVGVCASLPTTSIPGGELGIHSLAPNEALASALDAAGDVHGPWPSEISDADSGIDTLLKFQGARCALAVSPWRSAGVGFDGFDTRSDGGDDKRMKVTRRASIAKSKNKNGLDSTYGASLVATLRAARAEALARVAATSTKHRSGILAATANEAVSAATGMTFDAVNIPGVSKHSQNDLLSSNSPSTLSSHVKHKRRGSSGALSAFSLTGTHKDVNRDDPKANGNSLTTRLTSACLTSLAVAEALSLSFCRANESTRADDTQHAARLETATSLSYVAVAIAGSAHANAMHWRASAEVLAIAQTIRDDPSSAADALRKRARDLLEIPATRGANDSKNRAAAAYACAASFRRAGALAMAAATRPLATSLAGASLEIDSGPDASHLWAAHALSVVAKFAGPAFHKRAGVTLKLVFALLNSHEANAPENDDAVDVSSSTARSSPSVQSTALRASCGRLINAAVAAIGPELDTMGAETSGDGDNFFVFAAALMDSTFFGADEGVVDCSQSAYNAFVGGIGDTTSAGRMVFQSDTSDEYSAGDSANAQQSAAFVQQLALFAPRIATPVRLVPRLLAELNSANPTLRAAACETLKHLCERDAGAVARSVSVERSMSSDDRSKSNQPEHSHFFSGNLLFGDLLFFVDRFGGEYTKSVVDEKASAHARRALRLLVKHIARSSPSHAVTALAKVALWVPGSDWSVGLGNANDDTSDTQKNIQTSRGAPKLATRVLASTLIAECPSHFTGSPELFATHYANVCVDCGYRLATASAPSLRPAGLRTLADTISVVGNAPDPSGVEDGDTSGDTSTPFVSQFQAQVISALRSVEGKSDVPPRCFAEGFRLAATAVKCGVDFGDPTSTKKLVSFVFGPIREWMDSENNTDSYSASILTDTISETCAFGILVRLRLAALESAAVVWTNQKLLDDGDSQIKKMVSETNFNTDRLGEKWATVVTDFAAGIAGDDPLITTVTDTVSTTIVPTSLRGKPSVLQDLGDAWRPCLDAASEALFSVESKESLQKKHRFAVSFLALCRASVRATLALTKDDNGPNAPLAKPINPTNRGSSNSSYEQTVKRGLPGEKQATTSVKAVTKIAKWLFEHQTAHASDFNSMLSETCTSVVAALDSGVGTHGDEHGGTDSSSFVDECGGLAYSLASNSATSAHAATLALAVASGLARRDELHAVSLAAKAVDNVVINAEASILNALRPSMLITCVRVLSFDSANDDERLTKLKPFVKTFADVLDFDGMGKQSEGDDASRAAMRILFSDVDRLRGAPILSAACASVVAKQCLYGQTDGFAARALARFFSDKQASASAERAALSELRMSVTEGNNVTSKGLHGLLQKFGAHIATAVLRRMRLVSSCADSSDDVLAAAEGLKFWAALVSASSASEDTQTVCVSLFLSLAIEACVPVTGTPAPALASAAVRLTTSLAGSAPNAFRTSVGRLSETSTARLRSAMAFNTAPMSIKSRSPNPEPVKPVVVTAPITPPSFASFE